jgi:hypothetical protein
VAEVTGVTAADGGRVAGRGMREPPPFTGLLSTVERRPTEEQPEPGAPGEQAGCAGEAGTERADGFRSPDAVFRVAVA